MATVPTAANAAFYAQIVAEKAILRRLVEAGTRIVQLGYGGNEGDVGGGEVDEIVDRAQAEIYDVTERRTTEDYVILEELLQPTMDEIDAIAMAGGRSAGVPTGFADLDNLTNGLHPGQMIIVAARPGIGKALALDTPLITPTGWTTMGEVAVGEQLIGADGPPTTVVAATEVLTGRPCFEVEFSDGEVIVADAEHQWLTWDAAVPRGADDPAGTTVPADRPPVCRTTAELAKTHLRRGGAQPRHPDLRARLRTPECELPIDPWMLGYLLGAGDAAGTGRVACPTQDREWVMKEFDRLGHQVSDGNVPGHFQVHGIEPVGGRLASTGGRHVPAIFHRGSIEQRTALVQGLMDSDGDVDAHGRYRFSTDDAELARGLRELLSALGCATRLHRRYLSHEGHPQPPVWEVVTRSRTGLPGCRARAASPVSIGTATTRATTSSMCDQCRACPSVACRSAVRIISISPGGR